ncbi:MAG: hypothetical protein ACRC1U_08010, partial [Vibrionaceae bacterium]
RDSLSEYRTKKFKFTDLEQYFWTRPRCALHDLESIAERLPAAMVSFLSYLQQQVSADRCCLSGNRVYERVIAILLKALAFREGILGMNNSA